jgi:ABC-2 type transport system permease protein
LSYFARGVRALVFSPANALGSAAAPNVGVALANLGVLAVLAALFFVAGAYAIPRTD